MNGSTSWKNLSQTIRPTSRSCVCSARARAWTVLVIPGQERVTGPAAERLRHDWRCPMRSPVDRKRHRGRSCRLTGLFREPNEESVRASVSARAQAVEPSRSNSNLPKRTQRLGNYSGASSRRRRARHGRSLHARRGAASSVISGGTNKPLTRPQGPSTRPPHQPNQSLTAGRNGRTGSSCGSRASSAVPTATERSEIGTPPGTATSGRTRTIPGRRSSTCPKVSSRFVRNFPKRRE